MFEYKERYCEWKDSEPLDQNEKIVTKWKVKTDCGQDCRGRNRARGRPQGT